MQYVLGEKVLQWMSIHWVDVLQQPSAAGGYGFHTHYWFSVGSGKKSYNFFGRAFQSTFDQRSQKKPRNRYAETRCIPLAFSLRTARPSSNSSSGRRQITQAFIMKPIIQGNALRYLNTLSFWAFRIKARLRYHKQPWIVASEIKERCSWLLVIFHLFTRSWGNHTCVKANLMFLLCLAISECNLWVEVNSELTGYFSEKHLQYGFCKVQKIIVVVFRDTRESLLPGLLLRQLPVRNNSLRV